MRNAMYGVKQYVADIVRERGGFTVFTTGDSRYYLFSAFTHSGGETPTKFYTGLQFPVKKTDLRPHVRRALNNGVGLDLRKPKSCQAVLFA